MSFVISLIEIGPSVRAIEMTYSHTDRHTHTDTHTHIPIHTHSDIHKDTHDSITT